MIRALVRTARPKQWLKNVLVFAAPGAAGVLDNWPQLGHALLAFVSFCLAASGIYCWNDALDVQADRQHPTKRYRPVAAGLVSPRTAMITGTVLSLAAFAVVAPTRWQAVAVVFVYVVTTLLYSAWLKHIAVVDLVTIASGFVLRAAGGATAVGVAMSQWFVLCTVFGSLFIAAGKRYAELREVGEDDAPQVRASLEHYSISYLRIVLAVSLGAALVSYCQWAFETKELSQTTWPFYELSIVPMLTALLRYGLVLENGHGAAPEEVFASDRVLQLLGLAWVVTFGLGVYVG